MITSISQETEFERYAVYLAPSAESPLGQFGNAWLGVIRKRAAFWRGLDWTATARTRLPA